MCESSLSWMNYQGQNQYMLMLNPICIKTIKLHDPLIYIQSFISKCASCVPNCISMHSFQCECHLFNYELCFYRFWMLNAIDHQLSIAIVIWYAQSIMFQYQSNFHQNKNFLNILVISVILTKTFLFFTVRNSTCSVI